MNKDIVTWPRPFKVVLDMDGVMACFIKGFLKLHKELHGYAGPIIVDISVDNLVTKEQKTEIWKHIVKSPDFWETLPSLLTQQDREAIKWLVRKYTVYVFTCRASDTTSTEWQTRNWLYKQFPGQNSIINNMSIVALPFKTIKAPILKGIGANVFLDDSVDQIEAAIAREIPTAVLDRPYNKRIENEIAKRVNSVTEFAKWVDELYLEQKMKQITV